MQQVNDSGLVKLSSYIDGQWSEGQTYFDVINPANDQVIAQVANAGIAETEAAIVAAKAALTAWSKRSANDRAVIMRRWFELMMASQDDLARILTLEQGKPLAEAKGEIAYGAAFIGWFAEEGKRVYGDTIPAPAADKRIVVIKQPVGVVASITPWNFPNAMIARKAAAALAAGCSFVVRPATQTPLSALAMAELAERAGIPAGVFNVVVGEDARGIGKVLTEHPDIAKFTFTGSTQVGKALISQCASTVKKVSMELGGNAPFIVFNDADIDAAVAGALVSKYRNAGQTCVCTNRILVQRGVLDQFTEKFTEAVKGLQMGNGLTDGVNVGPMISKQAVADVERLVNASIDQGATVVLGYNDKSMGENFLSPTILTNVTNDMPIAHQEIFGPVTPIIAFDDEEEAISIANDTEFGLSAGVFTKDFTRAHRVIGNLEAGSCFINSYNDAPVEAPFGGVKASGVGRENSKEAIKHFSQVKSVYVRMGDVEAAF